MGSRRRSAARTSRRSPHSWRRSCSGTAPINAFQTYNGTLAKDQITDENIRRAQADVTTFLQDALGVQVKSGTASFGDSTYNTSVGDPMYDTILALNAKIAADGTTLKDVADRVALGAQACLTEQIQISIGGQQKKFCPVAKSDVPEEADTSILDYKFRDVANAVLLVKVRDDTVLSVDFTTAANVTYSCVSTACAGASLGPVASDESRPLVFGSLALTRERRWRAGRRDADRPAAFHRAAGAAVFGQPVLPSRLESQRRGRLHSAR